MLRLIPYLLKSLWRNRTRTLLTVSGAAVALFVYSAVAAVGDGFDRFLRGHEAERALIVFQENRFCPATSRLPEDYGPTIAQVSGVAGVLPIQVFTNNCRASLDAVVFHGMPAEALRSARRIELVAGAWPTYLDREDAALVGRAVAGRRGLVPGDTFTIGSVTVYVAGVFRAERPSEENLVYTHLPFLQYTPGFGAVGMVTQYEVQLEPGADGKAVAAAIDARFRGGPVPTSTSSKAAFLAATVADLVEVVGMLRYLGYACIGLVVALLATTTVMAVQDRVVEHAVLQTIGFSSGKVFTLVLAETVLMAALGGAVGVGAASTLLAVTRPAVGTEAVTIALQPSLVLAAGGLGVTMAVGFVAGVAPAWQAARVNLVTALRGA